MGNRAAGVDHRLLRDLLDRHILLRNAQFVAVCEPGEVGRWTVGINVRESARYRTGPTCHFADRTMCLRLHVLAELREALPCDRGFHRLTHNAARNHVFPQVRTAQELVSPALRTGVRISAAAETCLIPRSVEVPAYLQGALHPGVDWMISGFKSEDQDVVCAVARSRVGSLFPFDKTGSVRAQPGLGDATPRFLRLVVVRESDARHFSVFRSAMEPHPRFGNDSQCPFGSEE